MTLKMTLTLAMLTMCSLTTNAAQAQLWPFGGFGNGNQGRGCSTGNCPTQPAYSSNRYVAPGYAQRSNYAPVSYGNTPCLTGNCPNPQLGANYAPVGYAGQTYRPVTNCVGGNCNTNLNCANGQCDRPLVPNYNSANYNGGNYNNAGYRGQNTSGYRAQPQPRNDYYNTPAYPNASGRSPFYR